MPSKGYVENLFAETIGQGRLHAFFEHVHPDVNWDVKGSFCPISAQYTSAAAFHKGTSPLSSTWATPLKLVVQNVLSDGGSQACVEMKAVDVKCKNGLPFTNDYAWIIEFNDQNQIVKVRAYMDTDLVTKAIEQNPQ